jgi:peptide chain release factor
MPTFPISDSKKDALLRKMRKYDVKEEDLEEQFILGSGSGGQKINRTASCVLIKHVPSGMQVKCQKTRSQALNRYYARKILVDLIEQKVEGKRSVAQKKQEKIRRQKRRRSRRAKEKMLKNKKKRSKQKKQREMPDVDS